MIPVGEYFLHERKYSRTGFFLKYLKSYPDRILCVPILQDSILHQFVMQLTSFNDLCREQCPGNQF